MSPETLQRQLDESRRRLEEYADAVNGFLGAISGAPITVAMVRLHAKAEYEQLIDLAKRDKEENACATSRVSGT